MFMQRMIQGESTFDDSIGYGLFLHKAFDDSYLTTMKTMAVNPLRSVYGFDKKALNYYTVYTVW